VTRQDCGPPPDPPLVTRQDCGPPPDPPVVTRQDCGPQPDPPLVTRQDCGPHPSPDVRGSVGRPADARPARLPAALQVPARPPGEPLALEFPASVTRHRKDALGEDGTAELPDISSASGRGRAHGLDLRRGIHAHPAVPTVPRHTVLLRDGRGRVAANVGQRSTSGTASASVTRHASRRDPSPACGCRPARHAPAFIQLLGSRVATGPPSSTPRRKGRNGTKPAAAESTTGTRCNLGGTAGAAGRRGRRIRRVGSAAYSSSRLHALPAVHDGGTRATSREG
jgi:hypothetical protein